MAVAWVLAIDFGTTFTSAAVVVPGGPIEVLEVDGLRRLPSCVLWLDGELVVGSAAENQRVLYPEATERNPKRYLGLREHLLLGGQPVRVIDAVGAVLSAVYQEALRRQGGTPPTEVRLTHPARWSADRLEALRAAASVAGMATVDLLAEPVAAALHYGGARIEVGEHVAVYDLGGGTFDTAVLRRSQTGFELAGPPGGDERLGGEDFDHRLMDFLLAQLAAEEPDVVEALRESTEPQWRLASSQLLTEVRHAKEALSRQSTYRLLLPPPVGREMRITRPEFEALIRGDVQATIGEFQATIDRAGLAPEQVSARYLTGGSSRIPLVSHLLHEAFDAVPDTYDDPKVAVALGAAAADRVAMGLPLVGAGPVSAPPGPPPIKVDAPATLEVPVLAGALASTPPSTAAGSPPMDPPPSPASAGAEHQAGGSASPAQRWRELSPRARVAVPVVAALIVVIILAVGVFALGGDDDKTEVVAEGTTTTTATTTAPGPGPIQLEHNWGPANEQGVGVVREWDVNGKTFTAVETVTNTSDSDKSGTYEIVIPKSIAKSVNDVTVDGGFSVVQADPIIGFDYQGVLPGALIGTYKYTVELSEEPTADDLAAWAEEFQQLTQANLAKLAAEAPPETVAPPPPPDNGPRPNPPPPRPNPTVAPTVPTTVAPTTPTTQPCLPVITGVEGEPRLWSDSAAFWYTVKVAGCVSSFDINYPNGAVGHENPFSFACYGDVGIDQIEIIAYNAAGASFEHLLDIECVQR